MQESYPMVRPEIAPVYGICFIAIAVILGLALLAVVIMLYCKIFSKAGYHWAIGLLYLVPFGNIIILLILAFGNWPILSELQAFKQPQITQKPDV